MHVRYKKMAAGNVIMYKPCL